MYSTVQRSYFGQDDNEDEKLNRGLRWSGLSANKCATVVDRCQPKGDKKSKHQAGP